MFRIQNQQRSPFKEKGTSSFVCYHCQKPGHFMKDCPEITPKRSPISHPSPSATSDPEFPTTFCRCGAGLCHILVSGSLKNPGRKYYRCPGKFDKNCGYFKWCDELKKDEIREAQPEFNFPYCGCGGGVCTVRVEENGPDTGRAYFACPIKKGDGACNFKQWLDNSSHSVVAPELNSLLDEWDLSYEEEVRIDALEMDAREQPLEQVPIETEDSAQHKPSDGVEKISPRTVIDPPPLGNNENHPCPDENSPIQNSLELESTARNTADDSAMEDIQQSGTTVDANPLNPVSDGARPNFDPITLPEHDASTQSVILEDSSKEGFDASPCSDDQPRSGLLLHPSDFLNNSLSKGASMSGTILEEFKKLAHQFQNKLITILESMDPKDHETMSKEADYTFTALECLQVDYRLFRSRVIEYIKQAAALAHIEQKIHTDPSSEQLINRYETEKSLFDEVSQAYHEAKDAYTASSKRLNSLSKDTTYLRDLLVQLEKELPHYEAENARNRDKLYQMSKTISECKVRFWEATEALNLSERREIERSAAKAALELARSRLRK